MKTDLLIKEKEKNYNNKENKTEQKKRKGKDCMGKNI